MNRKTFLVFVVLTVGILTCGFLFQKSNEKTPYDYSEYFVPIEPKEESELPEYALSLELLQQINADVVGVLEFDDRIIYEPVVQAPDNEYYLRKNIDKKHASAGIPFIDADGNIFSTNIVIYGHSSTKADTIFTPLMNYKDEDYFKSHPTFQFHTSEYTRTYQIVSVFEYDTQDINDSSEFTQSEWRKTSDYAVYINYLKSSSIYNTNVNFSIENKLLTLVTCDTENSNERLVIVAKMVGNYTIDEHIGKGMMSIEQYANEYLWSDYAR